MKSLFVVLALLVAALVVPTPARADDLAQVFTVAEGVTSGTQAVAAGTTRTFDLSKLSTPVTPNAPALLKIDVDTAAGKINVLPTGSASAVADMKLAASTGLVAKAAKTWFISATKRYIKVYSDNAVSSVTITRVK